MTKKTGAERIQDTLTYLEFKGRRALANEIRKSAAHQLSQIGEDVSLETWHIHHKPENIDRRRALRALLLCQRVFLQPEAEVPWRTMKAASLQFWRTRLEPEIVKGIALYEKTTDDVEVLARVAEAAAPEKLGNFPDYALTMTRDSIPFPGGDICFGAIKAWLLQCGLVSMRWYAKHCAASDEGALTAAFGRGHVRWSADESEFRPNVRPIPPIRRGFIVHMYSTQSTWQGHWVVSKGDGFAFGINNGPDKAYAPPHQVSLNEQFRKFKVESRMRPGVYSQGIVVEIDPSRIPNRV